MSGTSYVSVLKHKLMLTEDDLSELSGDSVFRVGLWLRGVVAPPLGIEKALEEIHQDVVCLADEIRRRLPHLEEIPFFERNDTVRKLDVLPARGKAKGGFAGAYLSAVLLAISDLDIEDWPEILLKEGAA